MKVKLDNDDTKKFRLIKECDLQLYEGVAFLTNKGETRLQATPPFNDGAALSETHDTDTHQEGLYSSHIGSIKNKYTNR